MDPDDNADRIASLTPRAPAGRDDDPLHADDAFGAEAAYPGTWQHLARDGAEPAARAPQA